MAETAAEVLAEVAVKQKYDGDCGKNHAVDAPGAFQKQQKNDADCNQVGGCRIGAHPVGHAALGGDAVNDRSDAGEHQKHIIPGNGVLELFARLINCVDKQHAEQNVHQIQPPVGNGVDDQNVKMEQNGDDAEHIDVLFPEAGQLTLFAAALFQLEIVDGLLLFLKQLFYFHNAFSSGAGA